MKNIFFILLVIFTVSSCTYDDAGFRRISRKEAMESWAWKIFIYTDEGEIQPVDYKRNNFDNRIQQKPIFVDYFWEIDENQNVFLDEHEMVYKEKKDDYNQFSEN
ncbi:hypothetical protein [Flavobacterium sp.]|uniref:hypothetical protein n=1 Tax=Flavobacterium sp. TaxID=239 RepID=UPI002CF7BC62|nr:hypothetical protein [Flavobacterium sp.]HSD08643.1 hypothetical protein [Flavobacterium sp.]